MRVIINNNIYKGVKLKKRMKNKAVIPIIFLFAFSFFALLSVVDAAPADFELITPNNTLGAAGGSSQLVRAVLTANHPTNNDTNITTVRFYFRNETGSGDWTLIGSVTNTTSNYLDFNLTWDTTVLFDDRNIEINVTGENVDGTIVTFNFTSNIRLDNGVPTTTFSSDSIADLQDIQSTQAFSFGLSADQTIGITNCTVRMNGVAVEIDGLTNGCLGLLFPSNFSITIQGEYKYNITAFDDNSNSTASSIRTMTIYFPTGGGLSGGGGGTPAVSGAEEAPAPIGTEQAFLGDVATKGKSAIQNFFQNIADFFRKLFRRG